MDLRAKFQPGYFMGAGMEVGVQSAKAGICK